MHVISLTLMHLTGVANNINFPLKERLFCTVYTVLAVSELSTGSLYAGVLD